MASAEHPPEGTQDPFGIAVAIGGRSLVITSLNYIGDGDIWGFVR